MAPVLLPRKSECGQERHVCKAVEATGFGWWSRTGHRQAVQFQWSLMELVQVKGHRKPMETSYETHWFIYRCKKMGVSPPWFPRDFPQRPNVDIACQEASAARLHVFARPLLPPVSWGIWRTGIPRVGIPRVASIVVMKSEPRGQNEAHMVANLHRATTPKIQHQKITCNYM